MAEQINLNADIAEGWGAYDIGNDAALMKIIESASVACGFHAGDPNTMHRLCMLAKEEGVSIGVHPGFNDLWGFGRRRIQMKPSDLELMVAYQIGALQAMACYANLKVTHLKPHGALNNMAAEDADYAMAIGRAIKTVDKDIIYVALYGSQMVKAAERLGLRVAREGFADRKYDDEGNLASRAIPGTVIRDPRVASEHVVVTIIVKQRGPFPNRHCRDQAVDQLAHRVPLAAALAIQIRGAFEVGQAPDAHAR